MRIALIRQKYTPFGGAERYMARLLESLVAAGHEVHVFAASWDTASGSGATFHRVPVISLSSWLKALTFAFNCRRILQGERFDLILSLERTLYQDVYRAGDGCHRRWLLQKNLGKGELSRVATMLNPLHHAYLWLEKRLFTGESLKALIANSRLVQNDVVSLYGFPADRVHVVYNGIDRSAFDFSRREECRESIAVEHGLGEELRLLYVGSGFERKGVPALLRAAARLSVPYRLFIVGKGRLQKYERLAERLGIGQRVTFTGPVKDVARYYLGSDIFVFPTLYDPFSNATLEAMACGLPVITTAFNGVAELMADGNGGCVVADPLSEQEIADAISRLAPAAVRTRVGKEARVISAPFTMERNVQETMSVMEAVTRR